MKHTEELLTLGLGAVRHYKQLLAAFGEALVDNNDENNAVLNRKVVEILNKIEEVSKKNSNVDEAQAATIYSLFIIDGQGWLKTKITDEKSKQEMLKYIETTLDISPSDIKELINLDIGETLKELFGDEFDAITADNIDVVENTIDKVTEKVEEKIEAQAENFEEKLESGVDEDDEKKEEDMEKNKKESFYERNKDAIHTGLGIVIGGVAVTAVAYYLINNDSTAVEIE